MRAAALKKAKRPASGAISRIKSRSALACKTGKVVQFPLARVKKSKSRQLTQQMREDLVINTRDKARKLARSMLRKWRSRMDLDEVDSVVDLSLCEAAARFDASRGASFITFLFYHLRGNMIRLVSDAANQNTVPLSDRESGGEFASASAVNMIEVAAALNGQIQVMPDEEFYKKEMADLSRKACGKLDTLEQEVICRVFMNEEHLFDVAETLGYSRCHISRVKRKALNTLETELKSVVIESSAEVVVRNQGRRKPVSRRGCHRREILSHVAIARRSPQSSYETAIAG